MQQDAPTSRPRARWRFRLARGSDAAAVEAFLGRLSPTTLQARYLSPRRLVGDVRTAEVARILGSNERQHVVLLALDGSEIRGIAELVLRDAEQAEVALLVEDAFQGQGLGKALGQRLKRLAGRRGLRVLTGNHAYGNARVAAMLRQAGGKVHYAFDYGSLRFSLSLEAA
jgi:GNAT superfamily N-acetyltransferase